MNILMATMSLGIGGAETHIVELSRELVRRGHSVTIASDGGNYVPSLEGSGIRHVCLPLDSKRPDKALRAYYGVKKLIKEQKFDVVHSHSRISSFICGAACEKLGVRFVTTCHGVYDMNAVWRRLSKWGLYSLAVSYDTKDYLVREYGVPSDNIELTINGIDTERFSPMPAEKIPSGINTASSHRIIYVSRIDEASAHVAFMLAEKAKELADIYPDLEIELIGGGDSYDKLKNAAAEANAAIGRDAVKAVGSVTDVENYLRAGKRENTVFVGVSRAALEAMACGIPTLLSGSQGFLGIFDAHIVQDALDTNLCGRGRKLPDAETVKESVIKLFSMSEEKRLALGAFGRAFVKKHFTVGRMADDAEALYNRVRPFRGRYRGEADIMLSGYYGFGNIGDDSLLYQITGSLKSLSPDLDIVVLAHRPKSIVAHSAVRAIDRFDFPAVKRQMLKTSMLISGGGSLLQNTTSTRSLYYYAYIMNAAKKAGMKVMLYGSGIGPLHGERAREISARALSDIDAVTLRDEGSLGLLKQLGAAGSAAENASVTADPAFLLDPCDPGWLVYLLSKQGIDAEKTFTVSLRGNIPGEYDRGICETVAQAAQTISEKYGLTPVFMPLQMKQDYEINRRMAQKTGGRLICGLSPRETRAFAAKTRFVISMRLHLLIYAFAAGTPLIGFNCDPKIEELVKQTGRGVLMPMSGVGADDIARSVPGSDAAREEISAEMLDNAAPLKKRAATDASLALEILLKRDR